MASADILRAAHSPLPWTAHAYAVFGPQRCLATCDLIGFDGNAVNEANAAFIVRACNAHYQMLEALRDVAQAIDAKRQIWSRDMSADKRDQMLACNDQHFRKAEDKVRAAIAAAEREAGQ